MSHAPEVNPAGGENVGVEGHPDNIVSLLPAGEVRSITDVVRAVTTLLKGFLHFYS